ncbi:FAD binding domain protein [Dactylonectria macrodidyma]|uniref:FAD binding domain protein n=1 Tax=Dactylonectria macrodidyma TaxID=307937 RepID=A0A9P9DPG0_9HYPO|nr:FAD binding domain protein [Dactylonectria macrodidyma]
MTDSISYGLPDGFPILWRDTADPAEFQAARDRVWNAKRTSRSPRAIVKPKTVDDIVASVKLAERLGIRVSIRSGGHSWALWSVREDAVLIDLVDFKHLEYEETTRIVHASPSTTSIELALFLESKKRFTPSGHCSGVGLGGFSYGYTCEYLVGLDVVTADGEVKYCDEFENSDLFWAARGAGPGFPAIVTRFFFKTRPLAKVYKRNAYIWPIDKYEVVMRWLVSLTPTLSDDIEVGVTTLVPRGRDERIIIVNSTVFAESEADALSKLQPLIKTHPSGTVMAEDCVDTSFAQEYKEAEKAVWVEGFRYIADTVWLNQSADIVEVCKKAFAELPSKDGVAFWEPMNPVSRRPLQDMALSLQTDYYIALYAIYEHAEDDERNGNWMQEHMAELEVHSVGTYFGDHDIAARPTKYWSNEAGERLMAIRKTRDPKGRICGYLDAADESGVGGLANELKRL